MGAIRLSRKSIAFAFFANLAVVAGAAINILPKPSTMTPGAGTMIFGATDIVSIYRDAASDSTLPWVEKLFKQVSIPTARVKTAGEAKVVITMAADATLGTEGYKLTITATQVNISAPTLTGQFYAVQSLRQLFPAGIEDSTAGIKGPVTVDQVSITDKPRFGYRGIMVDPVRHWLPLNYLYQQLDRMALFKMNKLHLLIANDQGYRLESKVFPKLHELGSPTQVGGGKPPAGERWYYTHDEMRAVVKYAALRRIDVIPEVDMPGHVGAMVYCYPEIGVYEKQAGNTGIRTDEQVQISSLHTSLSHPNRAQVLSFIGKLWREMTTVFPSKYYQMGGDEWNFNTNVTDFRQFVQVVQDTLASLGKTTIAWDEVKTSGGLKAGNWSQDWHMNNNNGDIMSSCNFFYLDHKNVSSDGTNAMNWCVDQVTLQTLYSSPVVATLKGVEGTLFSERLTTYPDSWDRQIWPRLAGVAEVGWAPANNNLNDFLARLGTTGPRFATMGVKHYKTAAVTWGTTATNTKMISLYDRFVPVITPDVVGIKRKPFASLAADVAQSAKAVNLLGRRVEFSRSGHPVGLKFIRNK